MIHHQEEQTMNCEDNCELVQRGMKEYFLGIRYVSSQLLI